MELAFDPRLVRRLQARQRRALGAVMTSAAYYRREAERARAAAENSSDAETVMRWLRIAKDYGVLAKAMEVEERGSSFASMPPTSQPQQQPTQQQQSKSKPDDPD
jgi:hypothetical protein